MYEDDKEATGMREHKGGDVGRGRMVSALAGQGGACISF